MFELFITDLTHQPASIRSDPHSAHPQCNHVPRRRTLVREKSCDVRRKKTMRRHGNIGDFWVLKQVAWRFPRTYTFRSGGTTMEGLATLPLQIEEKRGKKENKMKSCVFFFSFFSFSPTLIKSRCQGTIL